MKKIQRLDYGAQNTDGQYAHRQHADNTTLLDTNCDNLQLCKISKLALNVL